MTGSKCGRLVEKKQLGVTVPPNPAVALVELEAAADPSARNPAPRGERTMVGMKAAAAIAEEAAARRIGEQFAEWIHAIGERHSFGRVMSFGGGSSQANCSSRWFARARHGRREIGPYDASALRLRLRRDFAARRFRPRPRLAGGRHGGSARRHGLGHAVAHRRTPDEQILDLVAR